MRDRLPKHPRHNECAIINLDDSQGKGTHWVAYKKFNRYVSYFDSYGNLKPPRELINYLKNYKIIYNHRNYQKNNEYNCGHLCLKFLSNKYSYL